MIMNVGPPNNRPRRNNDGFSTKMVALKAGVIGAAVVTLFNLWAFHSYYSSQKDDDVHLTHLDVDDEQPRLEEEDWWTAVDEKDDEIQSAEWEPIIIDNNSKKSSSAVVAKTTPTALSSQLSSSTASCFEARDDTVPEHLYGKLAKPYLNLGFPKTGTSSLHKFFECGGLQSAHYRCNRIDSCARCIRQSVEAGGDPLELCALGRKDIDVYAQMDDGHYFPQIEVLDDIVAAYPEATLFLTFRNMTKWYNSLKKWPPRKRGPHLNDKLRENNITGFPTGVGENVSEFSDWFCNHVQRVRRVVNDNPSLTLVEVDIEDANIAKRMSDMFEIGESCWGHANVNPIANPDLNITEGVEVAKKFKMLKNKGEI